MNRRGKRPTYVYPEATPTQIVRWIALATLAAVSLATIGYGYALAITEGFIR